MQQESLSLVYYFLGIVVAIVIFLIREAIAELKSGFLFRKRLVADVKIMTDNYYRHIPKIYEQIEKLGSALDTLQTGRKPDIEVAMIWCNEFSLIEHLYQNSSHLKADAFEESVRFYDTAGRLNEVRKAFNDTVRQIFTSKPYSDESLGFLYCSLEDMQEDYRELIESGCKTLLVIAQKHRFLKIDTAHYSNIMTQISQKTFSRK